MKPLLVGTGNSRGATGGEQVKELSLRRDSFKVLIRVDSLFCCSFVLNFGLFSLFRFSRQGSSV